MWTHLFSAPNSEYQPPTSGENFVRPSIFSDQRWIKPGIDPGARVYWRISNSGPISRGVKGGENGAGRNNSLCCAVTNSRIGGGQPSSFCAAARTAVRCSKLS
jgi:hypothetical protein